jgi:(p)ppGpp synthase/HD superfamily hydrolase
VTVLTPPRHSLIEHALRDAQRWYAGWIIDDRPALAHAARVAVTLGKHVISPEPNVVAAALLHDAPEFAPRGLDLNAVLAQRYGAEMVRIVRALEAEHHALDKGKPIITVDDQPVLLASTADKIVALTSLSRRAMLSGNSVQFFAARPALLGLLPHFWEFLNAGIGRVPPSMTTHLGRTLSMLTASARRAA